MPLKESLTTALLCAALLPFIACTTKGYSGPDLPDEQISKIAFHPSGSATLGRIAVDERELGLIADAVEVLPGEHTFEIAYKTETEQCFSDDRYCDVTITNGVCEGQISTLADRKYLVTVDHYGGSVEARVSAKSYFDFRERSDEPNVGSASCRELSTYNTYRRK